jgi:hypothetical protein
MTPGFGPRFYGARSTAVVSRKGSCPDYTPDFARATDFLQAHAVVRAYCRPADPRVRQKVVDTLKEILSVGEAPPPQG